MYTTSFKLGLPRHPFYEDPQPEIESAFPVSCRCPPNKHNQAECEVAPRAGQRCHQLDEDHGPTLNKMDSETWSRSLAANSVASQPRTATKVAVSWNVEKLNGFW
jgi:hypothetical protein